MEKALKIIRNIVFYIVIAFFITISVMMLNFKRQGVQPSILGYKLFIVQTGSMQPRIDVGDLILVKEVAINDIEKDDVITFRSDKSNNITTHRVKQVLNEDSIEFVTKGDANNVEDPNSVKEEQIIGKVTKIIPHIGTGIEFIQKNFIRASILGICIVGAILLFLEQFLKSIN